MKAQGRARESGFTLIELLVVIAIIGLLASIILASLNSARSKGRDARRIADIREIQNALELYDETCKSYPEPVSAGAGLTIAIHNGCPGGITLGSMLSSIPTDPSSGAPYLYAAFGSGTICTGFHLGAELEVGTTRGAGITTANSEGFGSGKCTNGQYTGNGGYNSAAFIAANNGDFTGNGSAAAWVYDAVP